VNASPPDEKGFGTFLIVATNVSGIVVKNSVAVAG